MYMLACWLSVHLLQISIRYHRFDCGWKQVDYYQMALIDWCKILSVGQRLYVLLLDDR